MIFKGHLATALQGKVGMQLAPYRTMKVKYAQVTLFLFFVVGANLTSEQAQVSGGHSPVPRGNSETAQASGNSLGTEVQCTIAYHFGVSKSRGPIAAFTSKIQRWQNGWARKIFSQEGRPEIHVATFDNLAKRLCKGLAPKWKETCTKESRESELRKTQGGTVGDCHLGTFIGAEKGGSYLVPGDYNPFTDDKIFHHDRCMCTMFERERDPSGCETKKFITSTGYPTTPVSLNGSETRAKKK